MKKLAAALLATLLVLSSCAQAESIAIAIGSTGLCLLVPHGFAQVEPENEILFMAEDEEGLNSAMVHVDYNGYTVGMLDELSSNLDSHELSALAQGFLLRAFDGWTASYVDAHTFELLGRSVFCEFEQTYAPDVDGRPVLSLSVSLFLQDSEQSYWVTYVESLIGKEAAIRLNEMAAAEDIVAFINTKAEDLARRVITKECDR